MFSDGHIHRRGDGNQSGRDDGAVDRIKSGPDDYRCDKPDAKGFRGHLYFADHGALRAGLPFDAGASSPASFTPTSFFAAPG
jgi:hypothetical protein